MKATLNYIGEFLLSLFLMVAFVLFFVSAITFWLFSNPGALLLTLVIAGLMMLIISILL